jgi:hypothetical protein
VTVEQVDVVDFATIDPETDELLLTIADHLRWDVDEGEHLLALQEKINAYLQFMEGGDLIEAFPAAKGRKLVIEIVAKYLPSTKGSQLIEVARETVEAAGYGLRFQVSPLT